MSDLDRVRRLFESAMIKALAVISEINTKSSLSTFSEVNRLLWNVLSHALQNRIGAI